MTKAIIIEPEQKATKALIWLHGLGASGDDFAPLIPMLHLDQIAPVRVILPHADSQPVSLNGGVVMPAWYDIYGLAPHNKIDDAGIEKSRMQIHALIQQQIDQGIESHDIMLAGFSQGGVIAQYAGLSFHQPLAGVLALSTYLPNVNVFNMKRTSQNQQCPISMMHGNIDEVVPLFVGEQARDDLRHSGYSVDWQVFNMGHNVCAEQLPPIGNFIRAGFCA